MRKAIATLILTLGLGALVACTPRQHAAWLDWHSVDPAAAEAFAEEWKANHQAQAQQTASNDDGGSADYGKWAPILQCESGGNWHIETGNGYSGGLQFAHSTWRAFGGGQYASRASQATPEQQIAIAEKVLDSQGWGAWPTCSRKAGYR